MMWPLARILQCSILLFSFSVSVALLSFSSLASCARLCSFFFLSMPFQQHLLLQSTSVTSPNVSRPLDKSCPRSAFALCLPPPSPIFLTGAYYIRVNFFFYWSLSLAVVAALLFSRRCFVFLSLSQRDRPNKATKDEESSCPARFSRSR